MIIETRRIITLVASSALLMALCLNASAFDPRVEAALTASDGPIQFGFNVAINGGTIAVYGGNSVYVFVKPASGWANMTQTAKLTASDGASLFSVAVFGDTVVAGSYLSGEAFVFVKPAGGWTDMTETAKLTASDGTSGDHFGSSVAISGNTVVVGDPQNNSIGIRFPPSTNPGAAYVFVKPTTGWTSTTENAKLTASDGANNDDLGWSVGIQGNTIVAGAPNANIGGNSVQGAVYVFVKSGAHWTSTTQTAKLSGTYVPFVDVLGQSVAINNNTIIAGGYGLAYVFVQPAGGWTNTATQTAQLSDAQGRGACSSGCYGISVAICNSIAVVGAPGNSPGLTSVADVFVKPASGWTNMTQTGQVRSPVDGGHGDYGWSVAVSGLTVVVGYPQNSLGGPYGNVAYVY